MEETKGLKDILMQDARQKGICIDGFKEMRSLDMTGLVDYYVANPDWCLERDFPSLQTITEKFADCEDKGIYVNRVFDGEEFKDLQTYIFHNCSGTIKVGMNYQRAVIPMLYIANGCRLSIVCEQQNVPAIKVPVYIFGENAVATQIGMNAEFKIFKNDLI